MRLAVEVAGTGFGPDGPYMDRPGQDLLVQSMSGLAAYGGRRGDPPTPSGSSIVVCVVVCSARMYVESRVYVWMLSGCWCGWDLNRRWSAPSGDS